MKPGCILMTRRQCSNQCGGGIAAHVSPNIPSAKNTGENLSPRLFVIKTSPSSLIIFQRAKLTIQRITYLCRCNWRIFWRKNVTGISLRNLVLARQFPGSPGTCNPENTGITGLPVYWSPTLFTGYCPFGLTSVSFTEKIGNSSFFFRYWSNSCRGILVG